MPKKIPLYKQIMDFYLEKIQNGSLLPGEKLPPERTIANEWQVNRSTVVRALDELTSLGWISRKQGSGTHVSQTQLGNRRTPFDYWPEVHLSATKEDPYIEKIQKQLSSQSIDLYSGDIPEEMIPDFTFPTMRWEHILNEAKKMTPFGYSPLLSSLSDHLHKQLHFNESQKLLITSGSTQGIQVILQSLLKKGDVVATEDPSFLFALPYFSQSGVRLIGVPQDEEGMSTKEFQTLCQTKKIHLLYLNPTYQNPTGKTLSFNRRKEIILICQRHQIPIIEDDIFGELNLLDSPPKLKEMAPNQVIYLGSLSKIFSPLIKIGWVLAPRALIHLFSTVKEQLNLETDIFTQLIAHHAISNIKYEENHKALLLQLSKKNDLFDSFLKQINQNWVSSEIHGGIYRWLIWKGRPLKRKDWDIFLNHSILIAPSFLFSNDTMCCRINYTRFTEESLEILITRFNQISRQLERNDLQ